MVGLAGEEGFARAAQINLADLQIQGRQGVQCRAAIPNHEGILFPGLSASVRVPASVPHKALFVPENAVRYLGPRPHVDVVKEKNTVESRQVDIGLLYDGLRAVTAGLSADDWVIAQTPQPPLQ